MESIPSIHNVRTVSEHTELSVRQISVRAERNSVGVAAVIATDSIHDLVHMAITQLHSSHSGDTPTQQQRSSAALPAHLQHTALNGKRILKGLLFLTRRPMPRQSCEQSRGCVPRIKTFQRWRKVKLKVLKVLSGL